MSSKNLSQKIIHKGFAEDDYRQEFVQYAYEIGGMDLVSLVECENANWDNFRKAYGKEDSRGFCMINRRWHKNITDTKEFREDWRWQMDKCNELMRGGTKFYGPLRMINGKQCKEYVRERFIIVEHGDGIDNNQTTGEQSQDGK